MLPPSQPAPDISTGSVTDQVDRILRRAVAAGASDIHIEPGRESVRVRFRQDGVLVDVGRLHAVQASAVASRIKVLAGLDVAERRKPQDGRFDFAAEGRRIDLRVSVVPTTGGEKVVLRVLDRAALRLTLPGLGLHGEALRRVQDALDAPNGLVLVTGPTGSGKSTTLYAALAALDRDALNVLTVEDPVEYDVDGVSQVHARPDLGLGFADALRSFLRQDPDVIMVGEIRDAETAQMAVRAALTGHLVLSTLHTNDAPSAAARLVDMGIEPYLLAASLRLVAAQRLVRLLCSNCKTPTDALPQHLRDETARAHAAVRGSDLRPTAGAPADAEAQGGADPSTFFDAVGCPACSGTGYRGRTAVYEVVAVDDAFASAIGERASAATLRTLARRQGGASLRSDALRLFADGQTSLLEVLRVTSS